MSRNKWIIRAEFEGRTVGFLDECGCFDWIYSAKVFSNITDALSFCADYEDNWKADGTTFTVVRR